METENRYGGKYLSPQLPQPVALQNLSQVTHLRAQCLASQAMNVSHDDLSSQG